MEDWSKDASGSEETNVLSGNVKEIENDPTMLISKAITTKKYFVLSAHNLIKKN